MRIALCTGAALCLAACSGPATGVGTSLQSEPPIVDPNLAPEGRLGQATTPKAYRLELELDSREASFRGSIAIDLSVRHPVHTLWLHSKELQVTSARLEQRGDSVVLEPQTTTTDTELLGLRAPREIPPGAATLHISWKGRLGSIQGLFRQAESKRWYIYSDFEATDARAAFPCYDDPRFKVPWTVSLRVPSGHMAFSNAPEVSRKVLLGGQTEFQFAPTRPLPSYLVAMAAGPFEVLQGMAASTPLRIIAPKDQAKDGRFVLKSTGKMLEYLETYLDMPMPFRKLDFIAVPRFGGAMENPGLITFSSAILLIGDNASPAAQRRALGVTAHELAHLWFGDYLTPDYWNDIWLNEAFATWLSEKAVAVAQPNRANQVLDIADKTAAYELDHGLSGRRVREPIEDRDDIRAAFDYITYRKGGAILTMMEGWIGASLMRSAVRRYLEDGDGGTVVTERLLASMSNATGRDDIEPFLTSFLSQTGIPQVQVSLQCEQSPNVTLRQSRYLPLETRPRQTATDRQRLWHMPVCLRYPSGDATTETIRQCVDFTSAETVVNLKTSACPAWLLPNDGDTGYYHYLLSPEGYASVPLDTLSPKESLGLVHSISASVHAGNLNIGQGLDLIEPMLATKSAKVHEVIHELLYDLANSVIGEAQRPAFAAMVRRWYRPMVKRIGVSPGPRDEPWITQLRPSLLLLLGDLGEDAELRKTVRDSVESWLDGHREIGWSVLASWLQVAALSGDAALFERYQRGLREIKSRSYRSLLRGALHGFRDPNLFAKALQRDWPSLARAPILAKAMRYPDLRGSVFELLDPAALDEQDAALLFADLCDEQAIASVRTFAGRSDAKVRKLVDPIESCMAFARVQKASAQEYFEHK